MLNQTTKLLIYTVITILVITIIYTFVEPQADLNDLHDYAKRLPTTISLQNHQDELVQIKLPPALHYQAEQFTSPFGKTSTILGAAYQAKAGVNPIQAYPVSILKFVGTINVGTEIFAFVQTPDGLFYQIGVGEMVGSNHGKVISITTDKIEIAEESNESDQAGLTRIISLQLKDKQ